MIQSILRQIVEGFGSKSLAAAVGGIMSVFMFPLVNRYFEMIPQADVVNVCSIIAAMIVTVIFKFWHVDVKTEGTTTTATLLLNKAMKELAARTPETSKVHQVAKAIDNAIPD